MCTHTLNTVYYFVLPSPKDYIFFRHTKRYREGQEKLPKGMEQFQCEEQL